MTKHLYSIAEGLQRQLLAAPWPFRPDDGNAVSRDAWASLYRWHQSGEHVYRVRSDVRTPPVPSDLSLATAPTVRPAVCYLIDTDQWMIVARHGPREPVVIHAPERTWAEVAASLTYATEHDGLLASGRINLRDQPTPADIFVRAGTVTGSRGARPLEGSDIAPEMIRLARILPLFYAR